MRRGIEIKLQHFILLFTLPALLLITCSYALVNYLSVHKTILNGFDRKLFAISTTTASFIDGDEHMLIKTESDSLYKKYVAPMQRILKHADLTYHYTIIPAQNNQIMYVLDAAQGDDHSFAGTFEENPEAESLRLDQVMRFKQASLSDIQQFDIWGELKIGSAPILNHQGDAVGIVGADVNISLINAKMNREIFKMFGIGALALLLSLWASLALSRKLIDPIEAISQAALLVSAGEFGTQVHIAEPRELAELASALNLTSKILESSRDESARDAARHVDQKRQQQLLEFLDKFTPRPDSAHARGVLKVENRCELVFSDTWLNSPSGAVTTPSHIVAWIANSRDNDFTDKRLYCDLKYLVEQGLIRHKNSIESLHSFLSELSGDPVTCILLIEIATDSLIVFMASGTQQRFSLNSKSSLSLEQAPQLDAWVKIQRGDEHAVA